MILQLASKLAIPFLMMALLFVFNTLIGGLQTTLRADLKTKPSLERVDATLIMAGDRGSYSHGLRNKIKLKKAG